MTRRCSHCSNNGHNSRTCPHKTGGGGGGGGGGGFGVKLFGVRLTDGSIMKKSASMGNLSSLQHISSASSPDTHLPEGYLSDDPMHASSSTDRRVERKKGVPWTEEEHRLFLLGLQKLGKGDWRGISRNYVTSRTPTQVASHAQKYFIRQTNANRRKRRSSLFDMAPDMGTDQPTLLEESFLLPPQIVEDDEEQSGHSISHVSSEGDNLNALPSLDLSLKPDFESMDITPSQTVKEAKESLAPPAELPPMFPPLFPAYITLPYPLWPPHGPLVNEHKGPETSQHQILKPIPVVPKEPVNVDELVGMSQLSLGETISSNIEPSPLSLKLKNEPSRHSAFHASVPAGGTEITTGDNSTIKAV
ncbi:DNA-binding transcription factor [Lithospermum erythrorhizon]|uniref:DNA-binding transcription factor n=1 Tax=Lithospermum erythrorhizon TaxID=34254 RepID=A0AAV3NN11_LITER